MVRRQQIINNLINYYIRLVLVETKKWNQICPSVSHPGSNTDSIPRNVLQIQQDTFPTEIKANVDVHVLIEIKKHLDTPAKCVK